MNRIRAPEPPLLEPVQLEGDDPSYWASVYAAGYSTKVFSVSGSPTLQDAVCSRVNSAGSRTILIAGCGGDRSLPQAILRCCKSVQQVVCSDYREVLSAIQTDDSIGITYSDWDMRQQCSFGPFDCIISINSIVSSEDKLNRVRIKNIRDAIRPGGVFIGLFPTVMIDAEYTASGAALDSVFELRRNIVYERAQGAWQVQYTPLMLYSILNYIFSAPPDLRLLFIETDQETSNFEQVYAAANWDRPFYELLAECRVAPDETSET